MKEQSDFKPGKKYKHGCSNLYYYYCVGHTAEGLAVLQPSGDFGYSPRDNTRLIIGPTPSSFEEAREPREFFIVFWKDTVVPSVRRRMPSESERNFYADVIKVQEVLD